MVLSLVPSMSKTLRHTIHRDHRHLYWDHAITPALTIAPGDEVEVHTVDAANGQLTPQSDTAAVLRFEAVEGAAVAVAEAVRQ